MSEENTKTKKVKDIFSDYKTSSNMQYANIEGLNVIKKTNTLQVLIYFDEYIEIKELWFFEKFLRERFQFEQIDLKIKYHEGVKLNSIQKEWKNIIAYMAHKYPLMKPMLLLKSDVSVEGKEINVKMHIKGADFLKAKKTDKELEKVLKNIFGVEYKVNLTEQLSKEEIKQIEEEIKDVEEKAIAHIEELNMMQSKENEKESASQNSQDIPEYNDPDYMPPTGLEGYIPEEEMEGGLPPIPDDINEYEEQEILHCLRQQPVGRADGIPVSGCPNRRTGGAGRLGAFVPGLRYHRAEPEEEYAGSGVGDLGKGRRKPRPL